MTSLKRTKLQRVSVVFTFSLSLFKLTELNQCPAGPRQRKLKLGFSAKTEAAVDAIGNAMGNFSLPYVPGGGRKLLSNDTATLIVDAALNGALKNSAATKAELIGYSRDGLDFSLDIILSGYPEDYSKAQMDADAIQASEDSSAGLKETVDSNEDLAALLDASTISAEVDTSPRVKAPSTDYINERDIFIQIKPVDSTAFQEEIIPALKRTNTSYNAIIELESIVASLYTADNSSSPTQIQFVTYSAEVGSDSVKIIVRMTFSGKDDDELNTAGIDFIETIKEAMAEESRRRKLFATKVLDDVGGSAAGGTFEGAGASAPDSFVQAAGADAIRAITSSLFIAVASFLMLL